MLSGRSARWWPGSCGISVLSGWWQPHRTASRSWTRRGCTTNPGTYVIEHAKGHGEWTYAINLNTTTSHRLTRRPRRQSSISRREPYI
jgi:hypothetical protein